MKLDERFDALARTRVPDQWHEISEREPQTRSDGEGPSRLRRAGIALLALTVAGAAFTFAARAFDAARRVSETPAPLAPTLGTIAFTGYRDGLWSLFTVASTGGEPQPISFKQQGNIFHPTWSPDGLRLAFDAQVDEPSEVEGGNRSIFLVDSDGSHLTRLTDDAGTWSYLPAWSPDGTKLAYVHNEDGNDDIWVINADGSDPIRLTFDPAIDLGPSWSPDGARIAFQSNRDGNNEIYVMNADGTGPSRLTDNPAFDARPAWSPTGQLIAFASDRSDSGIYEMNADGTDVQQLTHDPHVGLIDPAWSPDGTRIAYTTAVDSGGPAAIFVLELDTGARTEVTEPGDVCCPSWRPTPSAEPSPAETSSLEPAEPDAPQVDASLSATVDLGNDYAGSLAYGEGSIWVAVSGAPDYGGKVLRIDPATNEVIAEIATDVVPSWEVGGGGITVANGSVWLTGPIKTTGDRDGSGGYLREAGLVQIDPSTNQVLNTIRLGGDSGADVVGTDDGVWTLVFTDSGMEVVLVDPAAGDILRRIELDASYGHFLFRVGPYVIAAVNMTGDAGIGETQIVAIDPTDGAIVGSHVLNDYAWPASDGSALWVVSSGGLEQINPVTGGVLAGPFDVSATGDALAAADGVVWFLDPDSGRDLAAFEVSAQTVDVKVDLPPSSTPIAIALSPESVWVLTYEGQLLRVDLT